MKKLKIWTGVIISLGVFFILLGVYIMVATKINNAVRSVPTSTPPGSLNQNQRVNWAENMADVTITIDLPPTTGKNDLKLFGSLIDRRCYSPWLAQCLRDYSANVAMDRFSAQFKVPVGAYVHYGYIFDGQIYSEATKVNGIALDHSCSLGDKPNSSWTVVSFIVDRNSNGTYSVRPNPMCTENPKRMKLEIYKTGNSTDLEPFWEPLYRLSPKSTDSSRHMGQEFLLFLRENKYLTGDTTKDK